jgi:5-methylcytosine-specific restriction endonuclease McrA
MALFDVQMCCFAKYEQSQFQNHYDEIRERMLDLMCNDPEFGDAIEIQTSSTVRMQTRFAKWLGALDSILAESPPTPRTFPYAVKKELFEKDPTCEICSNRIMAIEDAEVDHKIPYSKGGPTTIDNAQLAHRYCNRHKSGKTA